MVVGHIARTPGGIASPGSQPFGIFQGSPAVGIRPAPPRGDQLGSAWSGIRLERDRLGAGSRGICLEWDPLGAGERAVGASVWGWPGRHKCAPSSGDTRWIPGDPPRAG